MISSPPEALRETGASKYWLHDGQPHHLPALMTAALGFKPLHWAFHLKPNHFSYRRAGDIGYAEVNILFLARVPRVKTLLLLVDIYHQ